MSEFSWAKIQIGGSIDKALIPDLIDLLDAEQLLTDGAAQPIENPTIDHVLINVNEDGLLTLESNEASSGEFKEIERWLMEHNLPYIRMSESGTDDGEAIPGRTVYWTPGMVGYKIIVDDTDGHHMIHVGELEWILSSMEAVGSIIEAPKFLSHGKAHEQAYAAYILEQGSTDPIGYLKKYLKESYTTPQLPEFLII